MFPQSKLLGYALHALEVGDFFRKAVKTGTMAELNWKSDIPPFFTHIAWHKDKWMTPPLEDFIELTEKSFHNKNA